VLPHVAPLDATSIEDPLVGNELPLTTIVDGVFTNAENTWAVSGPTTCNTPMEDLYAY